MAKKYFVNGLEIDEATANELRNRNIFDKTFAPLLIKNAISDRSKGLTSTGEMLTDIGLGSLGLVGSAGYLARVGRAGKNAKNAVRGAKSVIGSTEGKTGMRNNNAIISRNKLAIEKGVKSNKEAAEARKQLGYKPDKRISLEEYNKLMTNYAEAEQNGSAVSGTPQQYELARQAKVNLSGNKNAIRGAVNGNPLFRNKQSSAELVARVRGGDVEAIKGLGNRDLSRIYNSAGGFGSRANAKQDIAEYQAARYRNWRRNWTNIALAGAMGKLGSYYLGPEAQVVEMEEPEAIQPKFNTIADWQQYLIDQYGGAENILPRYGVDGRKGDETLRATERFFREHPEAFDQNLLLFGQTPAEVIANLPARKWGGHLTCKFNY